MKKIFNLIILTGLVSVSCEGPTAPGNSVESGHESLTKQLLVSSGEWTTEVKSVYVPGEGITLTGDEKLAVYYNAWSESVEDQAAKGFTKNEIVMAEPSDGDSYAFTHDELAEAEKYNYYFVMPYRQLQTVATHDGISKACWNLRTVQYPSATSYDPTFDYLIGKPAENVGKSETVEVSAFKRIVAPFKLTVNDPSGLLDGEKIHAVTVDFPEGDYVAGKVYIDFDQDYDETGIAAKYNAYSGTALTAVYPEGLSPVAGAYDVWYVALPASFQAGQKVSVTVTGETKTVTCSASLPSAVGLVADKFNSLSFGLSETKEDYESTQSLHFDFSGLTSVNSTDFSASDGKAYSFTNNGCLHYGTSKAPITSGLKIKPGNKLTLPEVEGKAISGVRVYTHEESWSSSSSKATLTASAGTVNTSALYDPQTAGGFPQGYVDLIFSEPQSGAVDLTVAFSDNASHNAVLTSVSLYLVEDKVEQPDVINDYYTAYTQGKTLVFGDISINNETHKEAECIAAADLTYDMMSRGGVYFIESSDDYVTLEGSKSTYSVANDAELILIGRYADNQPKIQVEELRANAEDLTVINVNFRSSATNQMICKSTGTETSSTVSFFDCMISSSATSFKYLIRDYQGESESAPFTEMVFDNCIIDVTKMTIAFYYASPSTVSVPQSLSITDNVIYSSNTLTNQYLLNGTSLSTLAVVVSGNTIANIYPGSGLIRVSTLASLEVLQNVFYAAGQSNASSSPAVTRLDTAPSGAFTVSDNIMSAVGCNKSWRTYRSGNVEPGTDSGNNITTESPFSTMDSTKEGYFPVNGYTAGASYSDKPYFKIK